MSNILISSNGPAAWQQLLADPQKHWALGYSARTLAHCWEDAIGFPSEIRRVLAQHASLAAASPLLIVPEWKVPLPGGSAASQNDIWLLAKSSADLISITIEGKVNEPFDTSLGEWTRDASDGKRTRLDYLAKTLGVPTPIPDAIRYQLLHRTASAIIEAERFGATHAVMLVHSFSKQNLWFDDFAAFCSLFGLQAEVDKLMSTTAGGLPLHLAWVHGDEQYLLR